MNHIWQKYSCAENMNNGILLIILLIQLLQQMEFYPSSKISFLTLTLRINQSSKCVRRTTQTINIQSSFYFTLNQISTDGSSVQFCLAQKYISLQVFIWFTRSVIISRIFTIQTIGTAYQRIILMYTLIFRLSNIKIFTQTQTES
ncbi:unnamed protein product [Paramecium primaurelia]|uniref:Uncharacterized protein n=1 Tax=Paramecium primaurelia TaxID=5886 RepID=A0A8S1P8N9_PARPR|nr:unnamed protein product [Paramecium primaurelia]